MAVPIKGTVFGAQTGGVAVPQSGVSVIVYKAGTTNLANLYSDFALSAAAANPITTEADGSYFVYAPNGFYDLVFSKTGVTFDATDSVHEFVYDPRINRTLSGLTETVDERDVELFCDASAGNQTVNLPALTGSGRFYFFWKVDTSANTVTLDPNGVETINNATTLVLNDRYDGAFIADRAAGWLAFVFDTATTKSIADLRLPIATKVNDYTLTENDHAVIANKATPITFTLPTIGVASGGGFDKEYWIRNIGAGLLTLSGTVDGVVNPTLSQDQSVIIYGDGTTWRFLVGEGSSLKVKALQSVVATGTAPLVVASTTKVANLNADLLDGADTETAGTPTASLIPVRETDAYLQKVHLRDKTIDIYPWITGTDGSANGGTAVTPRGFVLGESGSPTTSFEIYGWKVRLSSRSLGAGGTFYTNLKFAIAQSNLVRTGKRTILDTVLYDRADEGPFDNGDFYGKIYLSQADPGAGDPSNTAHHFGFRIVKDATSTRWYATNGDGTTEASTDTTIVVATGVQRTHLRAELIQGTNVKYYINGVLVATHATNLPGVGAYFLVMGCARTSAAGNAGYVRISVGHVRIESED